MKILVTGGNGFLGNYVISTLLEANHEVRCLDLDDNRIVDTYKGSVLNETLLEEAVSWSDSVIHLAAVSDIDKAKFSPFAVVELNVLAVTLLMDKIRKRNPQPMILASTYFIDSENGLDHIYGASKSAAEHLLQAYRSLYQLPFCAVRIGSIFGLKGRGVDVISVFLTQAATVGTISINGSGEQIRNFIHASDVARAIKNLLKIEFSKPKYYIVGTNRVSVTQLADIVVEKFAPSRQIKKTYAETRRADPENFVFDENAILDDYKTLLEGHCMSIEEFIDKAVARGKI